MNWYLDELLVNDTADRLTLLGIEGRDAVDPATGEARAIVSHTPEHLGALREAGVTMSGTWGYLLLGLAAALRRSATRLHNETLARHGLDALAESLPDLVRLALKRFPLARITAVQRELLSEGISIRDLRSILESLLAVAGTISADESRLIVFQPYDDRLCFAPGLAHAEGLTAGQLADHVRTWLRRYVTHKYTHGSATLPVYLLDYTLERALVGRSSTTVPPDEVERLRAVVRSVVPHASAIPLAPLLTTISVRRLLRELLAPEFPELAVLSYQELSPELNIQPIGRISGATVTAVSSLKCDTRDGLGRES